ncbi:hypothetical protein BsWGS_26906 [Bradybaena similaris]
MATKDDEPVSAVEGNNIRQVTSELDRRILNFTDITPMKFAIASGYTKLAVLLIKRRTTLSMCQKRELFEKALMKKQPTVVACLLGLNVGVNMPLSFGDYPLCFATEIRSPELVKVLLDGGANSNSVNIQKETALYIACREGSVVIANLLLNAGADVKRAHAMNNNFTPLIVAVANDNREIVQLLLNSKYDVNIDAQDTEGWTALWHAYSNCNEEVCALLLKAGANADIPNNEGNTIIQEVVEDEDDSFIHLFKKYSDRKVVPHLS